MKIVAMAVRRVRVTRMLPDWIWSSMPCTLLSFAQGITRDNAVSKFKTDYETALSGGYTPFLTSRVSALSGSIHQYKIGFTCSYMQ
jgi:hypothetical protein